jgi:hypothetical protein
MTRHVVRKFVLIGAASALTGLAARHWQRRWGATQEERTGELPGDDLVLSPQVQATRAISIDAPASKVWPWLVQLGWGKAGFYSYDQLERLVIKDLRNAAEIVPAWQDLDPGDPVYLAEGFGLKVGVAETDHALVLYGDDEEAIPPRLAFDFTWAFVVEPTDDGASRLIVRERYAWHTVWAGIMIRVVEWISFVMTQKMLRTIKDRAEGR